jgi:C-terminal processing protease CtpA/Prc
MRRSIAPVAVSLLLGLEQLASATASTPDGPLTPEKFRIGAVLVQSDSTQAITVRGCFNDGPAERAGLVAGDTLLELDGQSIAGWSFMRVLEYLIRDEPLPVSLTIHRGTQRKLN